MAGIVALIKRFMKLFNKDYFARTRYSKYFEKLPLDEHAILLEAQQGRELDGNIFYILKELHENPEYRDYKLFVVTEKARIEEIRSFLERHNLSRVTLLGISTKPYYKAMASAKYLVNDTSFLPFFIKKEGQVYLNVWHGTPLKTMGRRITKDLYSLGNVQKNFLVADYLLYQNSFARDHMVEDYMLSNIGRATTLLGGYPRNAAFFHDEEKTRIREEQKLQGKQIIAFMPTWRGSQSGPQDNTQGKYLSRILPKIDEELNDDQVLFVKLHPLAGKGLRFDGFDKIRPFPAEYETYEFLSAADCLITDYSSVIFDFAVTGKKIILFVPDKDQYAADRGLYLDLEELPFPKTADICQLLSEINMGKGYHDDRFLRTFCPFDGPDASALLCERVFLGRTNVLKTGRIEKNNKDNVLIYVGRLGNNGITASIKNLLKNIDTHKRNYFLTFYSREVEPMRKDAILSFPATVSYLPTTGSMDLSLCETFLYLWHAAGCLSTKRYIKWMGKAYQLDIQRRYAAVPYSTVIQFTGYGRNPILLLSQFQSDKIIYVHNDMVEEIKTRGNQRKDILRYAYSQYDKIALVSGDMAKSVVSFSGHNDHYYTVHNVIDYKTIQKKAKEPVRFDVDTVSTVSLASLERTLDDPELKKFITIGRFSPEKGHMRLLDSFNRIWLDRQDTRLIIIGGASFKDHYRKTVEYAQNLACARSVIIIQALSNPYSVLRKSDGFILPSFYEGFGIVLAEADVLGKPVVCVDIPGSRSFVEENGGTVVENSEEGIYQGLQLLYQGKIPVMGVDYEAYNQNAIAQFETLLLPEAAR